MIRHKTIFFPPSDKITLDANHFDAGRCQLFPILIAELIVGDDRVNGRRWHNERQAAAREFCGVTDGHYTRGCVDHHAIHARLEEVRRRRPQLRIKSVHSEKENIGVYFRSEEHTSELQSRQYL